MEIGVPLDFAYATSSFDNQFDYPCFWRKNGRDLVVVAILDEVKDNALCA
jgi:hypothetical protein